VPSNWFKRCSRNSVRPKIDGTFIELVNFGDNTREEVYTALEHYGYYRPWRKPR
jgi:hypothetical protein